MEINVLVLGHNSAGAVLICVRATTRPGRHLHSVFRSVLRYRPHRELHAAPAGRKCPEKFLIARQTLLRLLTAYGMPHTSFPGLFGFSSLLYAKGCFERFMPYKPGQLVCSFQPLQKHLNLLLNSQPTTIP